MFGMKFTIKNGLKLEIMFEIPDSPCKTNWDVLITVINTLELLKIKIPKNLMRLVKTYY